ncbi:MAG: TIR domain-containing protein [Thermogemmatispora sp.]|uniref:type ISP restriction/modification enzyme n=1 Tax=Thermogemmatispora sp. TaxID=1968838 RepID=UPI002619578B|nr:type ISP restriction/modification enzyme [Thermogemmatispora sp.]MBX5457291.1 TIR domain-containing protein [Thermogemmatispora sp.]
MATPIKLFYVYARADRPYLERLEQHLALLQRQGLLATWHDGALLPGSDWRRVIRQQLEEAQLILLLISPAFMASDYCYGVEMQRALERQRLGQAQVVPILLRPVLWEGAPFAHLQVLPGNARPISTWANQDAAFAEVVGGLRRVIEHLMERADQDVYNRAQQHAHRRGSSSMSTEVLISTPAALTPALLKRAIERYRKQLRSYEGFASHELALRTAFQRLLEETASAVNLKLIPEQTLPNGLRPDGVLRDVNEFFIRGLWEAKAPHLDLEREVQRKIEAGYPLRNTLFENSRRAILYQDGQRLLFNLDDDSELRDLLTRFLTYSEPQIARFEAAVEEFQDRIPELAARLLQIIDQEASQNRAFIAALNDFTALCRSTLNPQISRAEITEMLVQHLLTERLFRTVFDNPDFVSRNVIAAQIEQVIRALTSRAFNRQDFLRSLDHFYLAIEEAARSIRDWTERQRFLNTVYERFFQGFSVKQADTYGIVYTPQEIVDFMVASVDEALQREFGCSLATSGVKVLDPCTGTGNFVVNILKRLPRSALRQKYTEDLFCNEIMLLPYYIASLNIEHAYYERMGEYEPFPGICFVDTLELAERVQSNGGTVVTQPRLYFVEENTQRVLREKEAEIMVIIGNPPYNVGQKRENENNKNRPYPLLDQRIRETYVRDSQASNRNMLYDAYVRFFRWASDRLGGRDGVVCFVSNNSFIDQFAFDGMRHHLLQDFTHIYHLDLHGNVRRNPRLSGTTHNVFGIRVGVGITLAIRSSRHRERRLFYYRVPEDWRKEEKLSFLREKRSMGQIPWQQLQPATSRRWLDQASTPEWSSFLPLGAKESKRAGVSSRTIPVLFLSYSSGVKTNRDIWVYDFQQAALEQKVKRLIETYNGELARWQRRTDKTLPLDRFLINDERQIKWSSDLKMALQRGKAAAFDPSHIRLSLYRPFTRLYLYFDSLLNNGVYLHPAYFPTPASEEENRLICVPGPGNRKLFGCLATNHIADLDLAFEKIQCFPFYVYSDDGSRQENITDAALALFQRHYGPEVSKWDLFHYTYAILHHPAYRERYAEQLKQELPRIPLLRRDEAFWAAVSLGRQLLDLHIHYEQVDPYPLREIEDERFTYRDNRRIERLRLSADRRTIQVSPGLTLADIPPDCFRYVLGNRSALEWVLEQYQLRSDPHSGIVLDPNRPADPDYIVRLLKQVVAVSLQTLTLIGELEEAVTPEDWQGALPSA